MKYKLPHSFKLFFKATFQLLLVYLLLLLILAIFRTIILVFFNSSPEVYNESYDIFRAYIMGFRFDTMTICYGLIPMMVVNVIGIFFLSKSEKYFDIIKKAARIYYTILILVVLIISIIDLYFYSYFMSRISVLIFGFVEDDTIAVLHSIWTDYPVILITIGLILAGWASYKLIGMIQKIEFNKHPSSLVGSLTLVLTICLLFVLAMRGSITFYALRISDAMISHNVFINSLVPNGIYSLKTAFKYKKGQNINTDIAQTMKKWEFSSPDEAVSIYVGREVPDNTDSLKMALMAYTPKNDFLEQNPPNVVFIQMESMSEHFISLHNKENFNMLGTLEDVLPDCIHFNHFLSGTDGTISSLEGLMLNSPISPISQSIYMDKNIETSAAKPFKEKGYYTAYVTSNKLGWRNIDRFIPNQYFDDAEGSAHIEKYNPKTISNVWGTYDEFMFDRIYNLLIQKQGKPSFIFGMSTTNHTPHTVPETYKAYPIEISSKIREKASSSDEYIHAHFVTYQYANNSLGEFIKKIKLSPLGENTIIVASGDHTARGIFNYSDTEMLYKHAVPLILYIPEKYKSNLETPDTNQFGSHKDIFPTIYHLSLSDTKYVKSGINLFDKISLSTNFAIYNYKLVMNNNGCVFFDTKPIYYEWSDSLKTELKPANQDKISVLEQSMIYGKSYTASMTYLVQQYLSEKQLYKK